MNSILGNNHVDCSFRDRVWCRGDEFRLNRHIEVCQSGTEGDDLLRGPFLEQREESVDCMDDGDDVDVELQGARQLFVDFETMQVSVAYRIKEILGEQLF